MYRGAPYSVAPSANTIEGTLSKSLNDHESLKTYTLQSQSAANSTKLMYRRSTNCVENRKATAQCRSRICKISKIPDRINDNCLQHGDGVILLSCNTLILATIKSSTTWTQNMMPQISVRLFYQCSEEHPIMGHNRSSQSSFRTSPAISDKMSF